MKITFVSLKEIFTNFAEVTALNGMPHLPLATYIIQRLYWIVACLTGLGMLIFHTWFITAEYLEYQTVTSVASINNKTLAFPQITFCSGQPIKRSKLNTSSPYYVLIRAESYDSLVNMTTSRSEHQEGEYGEYEEGEVQGDEDYDYSQLFLRGILSPISPNLGKFPPHCVKIYSRRG